MLLLLHAHESQGAVPGNLLLRDEKIEACVANQVRHSGPCDPYAMEPQYSLPA